MRVRFSSCRVAVALAAAHMKVPPDMRKLAEHILVSKAAKFDPSHFVDHYEEAVVSMLKKKEAGVPVSRDKAEERPRNVVNLMDALKRSIAGEKGTAAKTSKSKKRAAGQTEMLLPISGKKGKESAKSVARPASRRKAG